MTALSDSAERAKQRSGYVLRPPASLTLICLLAALAGAAMVALTMGAAGIPLARLPAALGLWGDAAAGPTLARDQLVLWSIRIPRIAAAAMVGALLAASGAIMQGLFRNPLADPALVGVSSGGALAAAATIVFTDSQIGQSFRFMQHHLLPIAAFAGSLVTTVMLYSIASRSGRTSIAIFLLAGIAIAAIANAGVGLLVFIADDRQLRDITFWMLGSLSGATWPKLATLAPVLGLALIACVWIARGLDVLVLGEAEAFRRAAELTPEPSAARTYQLLAAGVERGVDLGGGLLALSSDIRDARREQMHKDAVRRRAAMLVPTIAILAPIMLLFIAAPLPSIVLGHH